MLGPHINFSPSKFELNESITTIIKMKNSIRFKIIPVMIIRNRSV